MGIFLLNTCSSAPSPEVQAAALEYAKGLFQRVQHESEDADAARQALLMEAYCNLVENKPDETLVLLEGLSGALLVPAEPIVAAAWELTGDAEKAMAALQSGLYQTMAVQVSLFTNYLHNSVGHENRFEQAV